MPRGYLSQKAQLTIFYCIFSGAIYLLVVITNGLIVIVNLIDWTKGRNLMPNEEILVSLALSNLCFSTATTLDYFISVNWGEFYTTFYSVQKVMFSLDVSTSFVSFWFTAWLSVFYCMKIVNFKHPFLVKVKLKFPGLVRWLLLGSVMVSVAATSLVVCTFKKAVQRSPSTDLINQTVSLPSELNVTLHHKTPAMVLVHITLSYKLLIIILGCSVPLLVVIFSSIPVLYSLFRHAQNLEQNASVFHNPRLEVHLNAAKTVLLLVISYVSSFLSEILIRSEMFHNWTPEYFLFLSVQLITLAAQGSILVLSNPKLKQVAVQLLPCVQR